MFDITTAVHGLGEELGCVSGYIDRYLQTDLVAGETGRVLAAVRETRGKMIRPTLLLLAGRFGERYPQCRDRLSRLGALVEITHMASLVHDDIVDDSPLRRGRPTVQSRFGKDMAVYSGDFMLSRLMYHLFREGMTSAGMLCCATIEEMCRGEVGQYACRWDTETTIETYLSNIHGKTVALFMTACKLGAVEGGCDEDAVNLLGRVGEHLGYLFQMRDDLLDFLSDEGREGKPVHRDFRDGIYTLPVLCALSHEEYGDRLRRIAAHDAHEEGYGDLLDEMRELVILGGGVQFTWGQIENHAAQARRLLAKLPPSAATEVLGRLIGWLRDSSVAVRSAAAQQSG